MAQIAFAGEIIRRMKHRIMQLAELDFQIAFLATSSVFFTASGTSAKRAFISSALRR